jgi:hypothetical protein
MGKSPLGFPNRIDHPDSRLRTETMGLNSPEPIPIDGLEMMGRKGKGLSALVDQIIVGLA